MNRALDRFCIWLADRLGANSTLVVFSVIAFVPFFFQFPKSVLEWQNWISQTCIQLIALNVIQKGTQIESARTGAIIQDMHDLLHQKLDDHHAEQLAAIDRATTKEETP